MPRLFGKVFNAMNIETVIETIYDEENNLLEINLEGEEMVFL